MTSVPGFNPLTHQYGTSQCDEVSPQVDEVLKADGSVAGPGGEQSAHDEQGLVPGDEGETVAQPPPGA